MEVKIGLIGMGNVGTCFVTLLKEKEELLSQLFDLEYKVIVIFEHDGALIKEDGLNLRKIIELSENFRESPHWKKRLTFEDIISTLDVNIIIETTPTNPTTGEPGLSHIIEAINNGKDVIASNKGPFYLAYDKIKKLAAEKGRIIKYEATVASCIPVLSIKNNLIGNSIIGIKAILNGTSNFILSRMTSEGISFSTALKEAQELGYAEADPSLDVDGFDAAGKLVILANELLGWSKTINDVTIKGISRITPHAIELARLDGLVIKPLTIAENNELIVKPQLIERDSALNISGTFNVIQIQTEYAGPIIMIGRGAGGFEAASAILNDLINIVKTRSQPVYSKI